VPTIRINSWQLSSSRFDGEVIAGPVPTCFAEDIAASKTAIEANPAAAHRDINKIERVFFMAETVNLKDALVIIKKPRFAISHKV